MQTHKVSPIPKTNLTIVQRTEIERRKKKKDKGEKEISSLEKLGKDCKYKSQLVSIDREDLLINI